jgi:hypothetical protein
VVSNNRISNFTGTRALLLSTTDVLQMHGNYFVNNNASEVRSPYDSNSNYVYPSYGSQGAIVTTSVLNANITENYFCNPSTPFDVELLLLRSSNPVTNVDMSRNYWCSSQDVQVRARVFGSSQIFIHRSFSPPLLITIFSWLLFPPLQMACICLL